MSVIRADLHVHTVLSPCAEIEMLPPLIVQEAIERGIDWIAITDHNASANVSAVEEAAEGTGLKVSPGIELQTREEVHVLCLFDELDQLSAFQRQIDDLLPALKNRPDYFGDQLVVDSTGEFIRREERLLLTSADISIEKVWELVENLGGLMIPAHINRRANGLIENLGFVPGGIAVSGLEISRHMKPEEAYATYPQIKGYPLIQSGDVHRLDEFLGTTYLEVESRTINELRMALGGINGRRVEIRSQK